MKYKANNSRNYYKIKEFVLSKFFDPVPAEERIPGQKKVLSGPIIGSGIP